MIMTPMERVLRPQEFCHANWDVLSLSSNSIPNILEKFWPRQWLVPAWMPRPVAGIKPSIEDEKNEPANFSAFDLRPCNFNMTAELTRPFKFFQGLSIDLATCENFYFPQTNLAATKSWKLSQVIIPTCWLDAMTFFVEVRQHGNFGHLFSLWNLERVSHAVGVLAHSLACLWWRGWLR